MGTASLVLGIVSIIFAIIPILGTVAFVPALVGLILGIVFCVKKSKLGEPKGRGMAGAIICGIAILFILMYLGGITEDEPKNTLDNNEPSKETNVNVDVPESKEYNVGDIFEDEDIAIKYVSKNENFTSYSKYADVKSGYKIIQATFEFENVGTSDEYVSSYEFNCYADGYDCESFWSVEDSSFSATLSAGKKTKGSVYFEVPKNAEEIILEYDLNVWTSSKVVFKVK